jgi:anti-sigma28 factor (negative regulator of flagellin synthesis)
MVGHLPKKINKNSDPKQDKELKSITHPSIRVCGGIKMTRMGEFDTLFTAMEGNDRDAFAGIQESSQVRLTHREDGSFVSSPDDTLLQSLGLTEERLARLRHLKAEIAGGRYFVSAGDVAGRLMDHMLLD